MKKTMLAISIVALVIVTIVAVWLLRNSTTVINTNISSNTNQEAFHGNSVNGVTIATPTGYLFCPEGITANKYTIASLWLDKNACGPGQDAPDAVVYLHTDAADATAAIRDIGSPFFEDAENTQNISSKSIDGIEYVEVIFPSRGTALFARKVETGVIVLSIAGYTSYQQDLEKFRAAVVLSK